MASGLIVAIMFTALAHGAVEAWSVAAFEMIVIALILLWSIKIVIDKSLSIRIPTLALPLAGLITLGLAQSVMIDGRGLSRNVEATREAVSVLFFLFICFLVAANFFVTSDRLNAVANFTTIYGLALALLALLQHFAWNGRIYWLRPTLDSAFGPFVNANHFAGYMEMLIPLPLALIMARGAARQTWVFYGFAAIIMGIAAVMSLSRGGMIGLMASMTFLALMQRRLPRTRERRAVKSVGAFHRLSVGLSRAGAIAVVCAAIVAGVSWIGAEPVLKRVTRTIEQMPKADSKTDRRHIWKDTLSMIVANPLVGVGLGAYETAYPIYSQSDGSIIIGEAHNDYLQIVADGGIIGGVLTFWFIVLLLRNLLRGLKSEEPRFAGVSLGCGAGMLGILVHSLFDFNLQLPSNALLFLFLSALAAHASSTASEGQSEPSLQAQTGDLAADSFTIGVPW